MGAFLIWRGWLERYPLYLKILLWSIPLPFLANSVGWTVAEVGRQPWIVYGLMRTRDAVSAIEPVQVGITLVGFVLLYGLLGIVAFWLAIRAAVAGPEAPPAAETDATPTPEAEKGDPS